jgi:hypothetical protein
MRLPIKETCHKRKVFHVNPATRDRADGGPCRRAAEARNGRGTDEPDDGDRDDDEKERDHVTHLHTFSKPDR